MGDNKERRDHPNITKASGYLSTLCSVKPNRRTGSPGNRDAVQFFAGVIEHFGFETDTTPFVCLDYASGASWLGQNGQAYDIQVSPYSLGCDVAAELAVVSSVDDLAALQCAGKILLMLGDICAEALMPKNFPFYNPEHHQRIYSLLEEKRPAAILTATIKRPDQVGALDPFPMIADGDFDIPSGYCSHAAGEALAEKAGSHFRCVIASRRIPAHAANVIARKYLRAEKKIVVTAHIDAYENTPGATDNATGTAVLLVLAEMLTDYAGDKGIEIAAFNGEDHYSAGGQKDYLARYGGGLGSVVMGINIDGVGYTEGRSAYSFYECPPDLEQLAASSFKKYPGLIRGEPWYSGDHMIFLQAGLPCLAFTSEKAFELLQSVTHTHLDTPDIVDPVKIVEVASALNDLIRSIGE